MYDVLSFSGINRVSDYRSKEERVVSDYSETLRKIFT